MKAPKLVVIQKNIQLSRISTWRVWQISALCNTGKVGINWGERNREENSTLYNLSIIHTHSVFNIMLPLETGV